MAPVTRSRYYFCGKIGILPFVYQEPANRNFKNSAKGTLLTKNVESVTEDQCKKIIVENVISVIKSKFPVNYEKQFTTLGYTKQHSSDNYEDLVTSASPDCWNIEFKYNHQTVLI